MWTVVSSAGRSAADRARPEGPGRGAGGGGAARHRGEGRAQARRRRGGRVGAAGADPPRHVQEVSACVCTCMCTLACVCVCVYVCVLKWDGVAGAVSGCSRRSTTPCSRSESLCVCLCVCFRHMCEYKLSQATPARDLQTLLRCTGKPYSPCLNIDLLL